MIVQGQFAIAGHKLESSQGSVVKAEIMPWFNTVIARIFPRENIGTYHLPGVILQRRGASAGACPRAADCAQSANAGNSIIGIAAERAVVIIDDRIKTVSRAVFGFGDRLGGRGGLGVVSQ